MIRTVWCRCDLRDLAVHLLYFSAQHEDRRSAAEEAEREDPLSEPEFPGNLSTLEGAVERRTDASGPLHRWLERRRELQR